MKKVLIIVGVIVAAALISAASFWGGMTYQTNKASQVQTAFFDERGGQPPAVGQIQNDDQGPDGTQGIFRGGGTMGEVKSIEGNVLTLSTAQDVTTVTLSGSTKIMKTVEGASSDLQTGLRVTVTGERDDKGNITASQITILNDDAFPILEKTAP